MGVGTTKKSENSENKKSGKKSKEFHVSEKKKHNTKTCNMISMKWYIKINLINKKKKILMDDQLKGNN